LGGYLGFTDISVFRPILSASAGVDKTLLYSSRMQKTCTRKHNKPSQDSHFATTLAGAFS